MSKSLSALDSRAGVEPQGCPLIPLSSFENPRVDLFFLVRNTLLHGSAFVFKAPLLWSLKKKKKKQKKTLLFLLEMS